MTEHGPPSFLGARLQLARLEVSDPDRLERILEHATKLSSEQLEVDRVGIWIFDHGRTSLTQCLLYERSRQTHSRPGTQISMATIPAYFAALEEMRVLPFEDARLHEATRPLLDDYLMPFGIGSMLDAPIFRKGKLFGIVCHEHVGASRRWVQRELDFAASVADMIALYFEEAATACAERRLLIQERELAQAERLASIGILARHVAHDLNNAVAPILMCAAQLKTALANEPRLLERVRIILDAGEHGGAIAKRLLSASAGTPIMSREPLDLDSFVVDAGGLLRAVAGDGVDLVITAEADHTNIRADPTELMRALINLVTNAREAMPGGGRISLRTTFDGSEVRLEITDGGHGMTPEDQSRLFEPFFTTKPGRGSGLGLTGVRNMVDAVRGRVEIESSLGAGTRVVLTFPSVPSEDE